jgi:hypothetical protein
MVHLHYKIVVSTAQPNEAFRAGNNYSWTRTRSWYGIIRIYLRLTSYDLEKIEHDEPRSIPLVSNKDRQTYIYLNSRYISDKYGGGGGLGW